MTANDKSTIRTAARALLKELWIKRGEIWTVPPPAEGLIPIPVYEIARSILKVHVEEPEDIQSERHGFETAGFMERTDEEKRIVIAQKHKLEYRRFTMAHEIAHWVLHPGVSYHRDRVLSGAEAADSSRDRNEQEADFFAAELLMPIKPLEQCFTRAFRNRIDGREPDAKLAMWLSIGTQRKVNEIDLAKDLRYRSLRIATTASFGWERHFVPLATRFGVTPTAMAIRLEDLGLVV